MDDGTVLDQHTVSKNRLGANVGSIFKDSLRIGPSVLDAFRCKVLLWFVWKEMIELFFTEAIEIVPMSEWSVDP